MTTSTNRFDGKVAFVTGGGTGIGRATAVRFASEGANVAVVGLSADDNANTVRQIESVGQHGLGIVCDVTDSSAVLAALQRTVDAFGGLDVAFNNAGIEQPPAAAGEITEEQWDRIIAVNLRAVFVCMRLEIPFLLERGGGAIVNTSSGAGVKGFRGQAAYAAAKHGVIGLTKSAALDYAGSNIRINSVCPGIIDTEMMTRFTGDTEPGRASVIAQEPIGRMGRPDEIAAAVTFLCSDDASFAIGHSLIVDGGQTV
jgi:NAD(P)-dependent dehydrogenase (short-subunit alcohol dehydrogenase family)